MARRKRKKVTEQRADTYHHREAESVMRPEVGVQAQFNKRKPPQTYRYDSSLSPALDWDDNPAREQGEALIARIEKAAGKLSAATDPATIQNLRSEIQSATRELKALSRPFLNWAGKAERLSFDVPTLPLFIHERLSTKAILDTLKSHKRDKQLELFGDPQHSIADQVLKAYEHRDQWVNRMILGDSLVVMNSLLHYEQLGGQVQMIYIDPPYGIKFGSNFQPFVRKRDVKHGDDEDMTREPEMVQAYRDTWELGLHSYLTYLRDRLLLARELLHPSGSIFVQISDENVHHVREVIDEVFGPENLVALITFSKTTGFSGIRLDRVADYLIWFARDIKSLKYNQVFLKKGIGLEGASSYNYVELANGTRRPIIKGETVAEDSRLFTTTDLTSQGTTATTSVEFEFQGKRYHPGINSHWKTTVDGLRRLAAMNRIVSTGERIRYVRYYDDFPVFPLTNVWVDTGGDTDKHYVVQTSPTIVQRCILMTTDPGDLVLDPTCGSGTTAYVAEQWGRRWITIDTSRVPLALARQRLLTATFPYYELRDEKRGPSGGFVYKRKQNRKGEEVGGIVPHITLKSIANNEPPQEEILVDRPETTSGITRVTGPFTVEATIPTPVNWEDDSEAQISESDSKFADRMVEVLRKSPVLRLPGNQTVTFRQVRPPAKTLSLSAEAVLVEPSLEDLRLEAIKQKEIDLRQGQPVAFVFGPENGAVSESLVFNAAREAQAKSYTHLYVIGFAIQPDARKLVEQCEQVVGVPATYVQATPDVMMGDLLKNMRSSQVFSVCGLPEVKLSKVKPKKNESESRYQVELLGLDVFDPVTTEVDHRQPDDVPAWFLDIDYNGLCFHVCQAFFPRTSAWDSLKKALGATYDDSVWDHLAGTRSEPFAPGKHGKIAVKVIDDRGNELLVEKSLTDAEN